MKVSVRLPRGEWSFDDEKPLGPPGGFGEVFAGEDPNGKPVAVKRLKFSAAQAAHRELTIAQDLAGKEYRHVLAPLDSGQDANTGGYFIVMPRADRSLASSAAALRAINAAEAERKSKAAAEAERQRLEHEARQALVKSGEETLKGVLSQMAANAVGHLSEAGVRSTARNIVITIGTAHLSAQFEGSVESGSFSYSNWRPVAIGRIGVVQTEPPWEHGATLWYMALRQGAEHRWYEVSYRRNALTGGPLLGPFAIQEADRDMYRLADAAAGPGMSVIEVQSGPEPIDDEHTEKFVQRWLERLALAYQGRLRGF